MKVADTILKLFVNFLTCIYYSTKTSSCLYILAKQDTFFTTFALPLSYLTDGTRTHNPKFGM